MDKSSILAVCFIAPLVVSALVKCLLAGIRKDYASESRWMFVTLLCSVLVGLNICVGLGGAWS